jgi:twitching motility protein PilT
VTLLDSLLDAIVRLDGEALVMHTGEKPYVVLSSVSISTFRGPLSWGQVELSSRPLTGAAVLSMLGQMLSPDQSQMLNDLGAIEHEIDAPGDSGERFTVTAARGGDDVWVEVRRRKKTPEVVAEPIAEAPAVIEAAQEPAVPAQPVEARVSEAEEPEEWVAVADMEAPQDEEKTSPDAAAGVEAARALAAKEEALAAEAARALAAREEALAAEAARVLAAKEEALAVGAARALAAKEEALAAEAALSLAAKEEALGAEAALSLAAKEEALSVEAARALAAKEEALSAEAARALAARETALSAEAQTALAAREAALTVEARAALAAKEGALAAQAEAALAAKTAELASEAETALAAREAALTAEAKAALAAKEAALTEAAEAAFAARRAAIVEGTETTLAEREAALAAEAARALAAREEALAAEAANALAARVEALAAEAARTLAAREEALAADAARTLAAREEALEAEATRALAAQEQAQATEAARALAAREEALAAEAANALAAREETLRAEMARALAEKEEALAADAARAVAAREAALAAENDAALAAEAEAAMAAQARTLLSVQVEAELAAAAQAAQLHEAESALAAEVDAALAAAQAGIEADVAAALAAEVDAALAAEPEHEPVLAAAPALETLEPAAFEVPLETAVGVEERPGVAPVAVVHQIARPSLKLQPPQPPPPVGASTEASLVELLRAAVAHRASMVYALVDTRPMMRVDGQIAPVGTQAAIASGDVERFIYEFAPRDLVADAAPEWTCAVPGVGRLRCVTFHDQSGAGLIFHLPPSDVSAADEIGLGREVQALCGEADGLIVVAGPRFSGKSTLLSAFVDLINRTRYDHIITIESQIRTLHEKRLSFISQREVRGDGEAIAAAARAALREGPDVLVIEDLRAPEALVAALDAARAGRLVFGTISAQTAPDAIERLIDAIPADRRSQIRAALAGALRAVVAQVLVRKKAGGRVAAREVLLSSPAVRKLLLDGATWQLPIAVESGRSLGMNTMVDSLGALVRDGVVEIGEACGAAPDRRALIAALARDGVDVSGVERRA